MNKKNVKFEWNEQCDIAFKKVQIAINNADILRHPNYNKEFFIWTDASKYAYGAALMQLDENKQY